MPKPLGSIPQIPALGTTPTANPPSGSLLLYFKSDGLLYQKDSTGVETQVAGGGAPSGPAGGSLAGTYPNPSLAAGAVNSAEINAAIKDAAAATASLRTLGTGATQAAAGNHGHVLTGAEITGTLPIAKGGTNSTATPTLGGVGYGTGSAHAYTAAGTAKQVMASNGAAAPTWQALDLTYMPDAWVKKAARVATTANITLSGTQTIDGVAVVAGDRVLVKNQTTAAQNGIYTVAAGAWTRVAGGDTSAEIAGAAVNVDQGTQGGQIWSTTFKTTDTLGTTAMVWSRVGDGTTSAANRIQSSLTGGGTITLDASYNFGWTARFITMGGGRGLHWGTSGYFDITQPAVGTVITGYGGAANQTVVAAGVPIIQWVALYYEPNVGGTNASDPARFRLVGYTGDFVVPDHWVLLAIRGEGNQVRVGTGHLMYAGQTATVANPYNQYSLTSHTHTTANVTGLDAELNARPELIEYTTTVPARPATTGKVIWQGQADPAANALAGDSWWPTA